MSVIALASASGSPGATTTAVAMALTWPRPVIVLEADPHGGSAILAGFFQGQHPHDRGLVSLAEAHRNGDIAGGIVRSSIAFPGAEHARFLPGLRTLANLATVDSLWPDIAVACATLHQAGTDVIVDAGRLGADRGPMPLLLQADTVCLVTRSDLPAVASTRLRAAALRDQLLQVGAGEDPVKLLLVGPGRPYGAKETAAAVGCPVAATVAWAPEQAQVISHGESPQGKSVFWWRDSHQNWDASGYMRSIRSVTAALFSNARERRGELEKPEDQAWASDADLAASADATNTTTSGGRQ